MSAASGAKTAFEGKGLEEGAAILMAAVDREIIHSYRSRAPPHVRRGAADPGGIAGSNQFDTVVVVDVEREFQTLLTGPADLLPAD
jgi:hypothetical protein